MCVLQGTLISPNKIRQATGSAMPRRYSICGKHSAAEYTKKTAQCKLVCNCNGFLQMCVLQGTLISPNKIRQATGSAMPRRYSICGKHSAAEYTKKTAQCKLVCNCNGFLQMCVLQGTLISPNKIRQATGSALPRRYSICGKLSAAEYTKKPARCKLVCNCNGFSQMCVLQGTLISPNRIRSGNGECSAEALQYMRQAKRSRIYEETGGVQTCLQLQWLLATAGAVRQPYISK